MSIYRTRRHWYDTGSGSDRAPIETPSQQGARSLPLPVPYRRVSQCWLVRFSIGRLYPNLSPRRETEAKTLSTLKGQSELSPIHSVCPRAAFYLRYDPCSINRHGSPSLVANIANPSAR